MAEMKEVLDKCIDHIMAGSRTIEECLAEHPSFSEELKPFLELALELKEQPAVTMTRGAKTRIRRGIMEGINAERTARRPWWERMVGPIFGKAIRRGHAFAGAAIALLLIVALTGAGIVHASQGSIPGDTLYPVKRGVERARLSSASNDRGRAKLHLTFADQRVEEIVGVADRDRETELEGLLGDYTQELEAASQVAGTDPGGTEAEGGGMREEVLASVQEATSRHIQVLERALECAPAQAQPGLGRALEASRRGQERASAALGHLGPPTSVPQGRQETSNHAPTPEPGATIHVAAITMWYERKGANYFVYAGVAIVNENEQPVSGVSVSVEIELPDGSVSTESGATGSEGMVTFRVLSRQGGAYTSMVTDVVKEGWSYDPTADIGTSESLPVP